MREFLRTHPKTRWVTLALGALVLLVVLCAAFFDWNLLRAPLARMIATRIGRPVSIRGDLRVHLLSLTPSADLGGLTIANPPWARNPTLFTARALQVSVSLGHLLKGELVIPRLALVAPQIDVERDREGRASWQFGAAQRPPPAAGRSPAHLPPIRRLLIEDGKVSLSDAIRKLELNGSLEADDAGRAQQASAFKIVCSGTLNAKPFRAQVHGGPLIDLDPDHPYHLQADIHAADIELTARVTFPTPFDLASVRATFDLSGGDLADVYYLTGLALPNTPPYRLSGDVRAEGTAFRLDDLRGTLGSSDLEGRLRIETASARPKITATLHSRKLDLIDLAPTLGHPVGVQQATSASLARRSPSGAVRSAADRRLAHGGLPPASARAAAPAPTSDASSGHLFPDAQLQLERVRGTDADLTYEAGSIMAKVPLRRVAMHLTLEAGLLRIDPLAFTLQLGRFAGNVELDARPAVPHTRIEMRISDIHLEEFKTAQQGQAPLQGTMVGRLRVEGSGASVHEVAASADGGVSIALPHGQIDSAFAELAGIDAAKGLGILMSKPDQRTDIRCGVADFQASGGVLHSRAVFVDTTNVLITGRGTIDLGKERLDLALQGKPKKFRFVRLRTPVMLTGTLLHPSIGVKAQNLLAQAGVATALGALLTPVAAALAFIDPGLAKSKDCEAVLAEAHTDESPSPSAPPPGTPQAGVGASQPH